MSNWRERIASAHLPTAVIDRAESEIERLDGDGAERGEIERYLETLLAVPWSSVYELPTTTLAEAAILLEESHVGLEDAKERVLEELAIRELAPDAPGRAFVFVGPAYTGKSHFAQTIANLLGRPLVRLSLAGVSHESDLRGRDRGSVHPHPGMFVDALIQAGASDPVIYLGDANRMKAIEGDPIDALIGALDPSRSHSFLDRYLGMPVDLSHALIILSTQGDSLPDALASRVNFVDFSGYTVREKEAIAKRFILPAQVQSYGLEGRLRVTDGAIRGVIEGWTYEPGVGRLEARINVLARAAARRIVGAHSREVVIDTTDLEDILGPRPLDVLVVHDQDSVGVVNGLVMNAAEGAITSVEAFTYPGREDFFVTGRVGDVMRESCRVAWSVVRRNRDQPWALPKSAFEGQSLHLHFPKGGVEKDGPSGGIAIALAIESRFAGIAVRHDVAMTGEINLQGQVLRIGGLKKKLLGAHRAGARVVIIPRENAPDLIDVPAEVRDELEIVLVSHINEVFERALLGTPTSETPVVPDEAVPVVVALEPHEPRGPQGGAVSLPAEASEAKKTLG